jgi:hypothetical protein
MTSKNSKKSLKKYTKMLYINDKYTFIIWFSIDIDNKYTFIIWFSIDIDNKYTFIIWFSIDDQYQNF